jgi:hypothetical protein
MRIRLFLLGLGLVAASITASTAAAGDLRDSAASCSSQVLEQPFKRWLDPAKYFLVPGGSFEDGAPGWQLNGSSLASGNESFAVRGLKDATSLAIPNGASATTPAMCATLLHPDLRFFVRNKGSLLGLLRVDVLVDTPLGVVTLPISVVPAGQAWVPTLPIPFLVNALALVGKDGTTGIAFRFTAMLGGSFQIDDVYVDPYRSA